MQIPILMYHSVASKSDVSDAFRRWSITPTLFSDHMTKLLDTGFTPLSVSQYLYKQEISKLPDQPVVITFDDGLEDFYTNAFPILKKLRISATLYVTTGFVGRTSEWLANANEGNRPMMNWQQIREVDESFLVEIGAHTHYHPQLDAIKRSRSEEEIKLSRTILEEKLGHPILSFAYPHGFHDSTVRQHVIDAGFQSACGVKHALSHINDDPFSLSRIIVSNDTTSDQLIAFTRGEGIPSAPKRERFQTKGWRLIRRSANQLHLPINV